MKSLSRLGDGERAAGSAVALTGAVTIGWVVFGLSAGTILAWSLLAFAIWVFQGGLVVRRDGR